MFMLNETTGFGKKPGHNPSVNMYGMYHQRQDEAAKYRVLELDASGLCSIREMIAASVCLGG